ncbi:DNA primase [Candidatus Micrarchaeota archaeon]|nr:DNA primase [Candidatus Micrarchaeota archaeon]
MGKTYIDTLKYMIYADVFVEGIVEKPDIVGAVFGQTEGLLGDDLDLRELQKNGRIGRIEVTLEVKNGKTYGKLYMPSSLDMVETSILAAALESVDRIGPCEGHITVKKIEDTRNAKRKLIIDRAKTLLKNMLDTVIPDSRELSEIVRGEVKTAEVVSYGPDKLPAGPNIDKYDSVIVVEGRADVLNLLRNDIQNVIAVGGASVPKSIGELSKRKEITVFIDGDRGGNIILTQLSKIAEIDYVARAPTGKEVEELTRKELIKCLRNKVPFAQAIEHLENIRKTHKSRAWLYQERKKSHHGKEEISEHDEGIENPPSEHEQQREPEPEPVIEENPYLAVLKEIENTLQARFYDKKFKLIKEVPIRSMLKILENEKNVDTVIFDGIITQRLIDVSSSVGVKRIVGLRVGNVYKPSDKIEMLVPK